MAPESQSQSQSQYLDLPLAELHDSPTQPRLAYDAAYLAELAADIQSHGRNLSPLLVRPIVPPLFAQAAAATGDAALAASAQAGYEIVFGHCRKRACELAGLPTARCEVRTLTDEEVERAQISENLQRKNVHPFEEAQGYQALIQRHADTPDAIAARTGKSRSYIYGRLKLLQACAEVRQACVAGAIGAEVALLIARLRSDKLQAKALKRIEAKAWDIKDGGARSYRNIRDLLNEEFTLDLKAAPFPIDVVLAGAGPCPACPKRSANAPEYQDVAEDRKTGPWCRQNLGANVCTDPDCFAAKKAAHFANQAGTLRRQGRVVIEGNKARALVGADGKLKGGYLPLAAVKDELKRAKDKLPSPPVAVIIQCPRAGKTFEAVKEAELVQAGVRTASAGSAKSGGGSNTSSHTRDAYARQLQERQQAVEAATARNKQLLRAVREAAQAQARSDFDLRLICTGLLDRDDDYYHGGLTTVAELRGVQRHELRGQIDLLPASELALLMLDIVLAEDIEDDASPLHLAAKHYGIDAAALETQATDGAPDPIHRCARHQRHSSRNGCGQRGPGLKPGRLRRQS
jgi:ParB/RepB/Spo0J family partition protein